MKKAKAMRNTKPRRVIIEELRKVTSHPTADEMHKIVRRRLPKVSLGTVYRNLELLSAKGTILKLEVAGTQRRYDGTIDKHYHVRCVSCGRVDDLNLEPVLEIEGRAQEKSDYLIKGHRIEFDGICPRCGAKLKMKQVVS